MASALSPTERLEAGVLRGAAALPPRAQRVLGGPRRVTIDGQVLDPEAQLLLRLLRLSRRPAYETLPVPEARAEIRREAARRIRPAAAGREGRRTDAARSGRRAAQPGSTCRSRPPLPGRCSSTSTVAAGSSAISTPTIRPAVSSPVRQACACWRSTTGSRPSTRFRRPSTMPWRRCASRSRRPGGWGPILPGSRSEATARAPTLPPPRLACSRRTRARRRRFSC